MTDDSSQYGDGTERRMEQARDRLEHGMKYIADVDDTDTQIALELKFQQAHAVLGGKKESLYQYVDTDTDRSE